MPERVHPAASHEAVRSQRKALVYGSHFPSDGNPRVTGHMLWRYFVRKQPLLEALGVQMLEIAENPEVYGREIGVYENKLPIWKESENFLLCTIILATKFDGYPTFQTDTALPNKISKILGFNPATQAFDEDSIVTQRGIRLNIDFHPADTYTPTSPRERWSSDMLRISAHFRKLKLDQQRAALQK